MQTATLFPIEDDAGPDEQALGCAMAGGRRKGAKRERPIDDHYPTNDPAVVRALLLAEPELRDAAAIWEPACGAGDMATALDEYGAEVFATNVIDRGFGEPGVNFLTQASFPSGVPMPIVTNPPFECRLGTAAAFIEHAVLRLEAPFVAMLTKTTFWQAKERLPLYLRCPPSRIYPLTWRVDFTGQGDPTMDVIWNVWSRKSPDATFFRPLSRPAPRGQGEILRLPLPGLGHDPDASRALAVSLSEPAASPEATRRHLVEAGWRPPLVDVGTVIQRRCSRDLSDREWRKECVTQAADIIRAWFKVDEAQFWKSSRGGRKASDARKVAYYIGNTVIGSGYTELSEVFRRARRTVEKGIFTVEDARTDEVFDSQMFSLERLVCQLVFGVPYEEMVKL